MATYFNFCIDVTFEMRTVHFRKCIYSIDDHSTRSNQFYTKIEKGERGQDSGETERESEGESARVGIGRK
jgi:hypothetical protein